LALSYDFILSLFTGVIYTNQTVQFNPRQRDIHLVVTANDDGNPQRSAVAAVRVQVMDVNNHAPKFLPATYRYFVLINLVV
jgi:protocadherin-16/23